MDAIGQALGVVHYANRTESARTLALTNGTTDAIEIPISSNWRGNSADLEISGLQESRNWVNGTFAWDEMDDGTYGSGEDDTLDIVNTFQNWTFSAADSGNTNTMSGNYFNSSSLVTGRNALELRMNGFLNGLDQYQYEGNDHLNWTTEFEVPRGNFIDGTLRFSVNATHVMNVAGRDLRIYLDGVQIYLIDVSSIRQISAGTWREFSLQKGIWYNTTDIFSGNIEAGTHNLTFSLIQPLSITYSAFENIDYQQIHLAGIELEVVAGVQANQVDLRVDDVPVDQVEFGIGALKLTGAWDAPSKVFTFSCANNGSYELDLTTSVCVNTSSVDQTTLYEKNLDSFGAKFHVQNETAATWTFFCHVLVPPAYAEQFFEVTFPDDWTLTNVSTPGGSASLLGSCVVLPGRLLVPVVDLVPDPTGFWKVEAEVANYGLGVGLEKNATGGWVTSNRFSPGDQLRLGGLLKTDGNFTTLEQTLATMELRFPNGTTWTAMSRFATVEAGGTVTFPAITLPSEGPELLGGDYQAICTWNNSIGGSPINETGYLFTTFRLESYLTASHISHPSDLTYAVGSTGNAISWVITAAAGSNASYEVYNGTALVTNATWTTGQEIQVDIDGLAVGEYNFSILASDGLGGTVSDKVVVKVIDPEIDPRILYGSIAAAVGIGGVSVFFWVRRKRQLRSVAGEIDELVGEMQEWEKSGKGKKV